MSTFIGKYDVKADAKGRVFIPSHYRKLLPETDRGRIVMRRDADHDCLILYPEAVWDVKVNELKAVLDEWNPDDQLMLMQFMADAEWLDIDSQGRILLPKRQLEILQPVQTELIFVGMLDRMAIWSKAGYEKVQMSPKDFAARLKDKMERKNG